MENKYFSQRVNMVEYNQEVLDTRTELNGLIQRILNDWRTSCGNRYMPEHLPPITFASGVSLWAITEKVASNAIKEMVAKREAVIAVTSEFMPLVYKTGAFEINRNTSNHKANPVAILPSNFFARCRVDGVYPEQRVENCLTEIIYWDARIGAEKIARAKYEYARPDLIVQVCNLRIKA